MQITYDKPTSIAIKTVLEAHFPNTSWQVSLSGLDDDLWVAQAYQFNLVVRTASIDKSQASQFAKAFAILELLYARGCPVPEPIATSVHTHSRLAHIHFDWIITRQSIAKPLANKSLSAENAYRIGEMLAHLHHIQAQGYGFPQLTRSGFVGRGTSIYDGVRAICQSDSIWGLDDTVSLESMVIRRRFPQYIPQLNRFKPDIVEAIHREQPVICHANLHTSTVLIDAKDKLATILGFDDACLLPPAWDFAIAACDFGWRAVEDMLVGYTPDDSEQITLLHDAYLLGLIYGLYQLERHFASTTSVIRRARTVQFLTHTLNRLKQR
ncbi:MAG: aminoglycoside phosphotransferase family protein [Chloroflexota bacterium]